MCFSANASFGAGAVLTVIGVATMSKAKKPSQLVFAAIPLLFAVQQISEGFTWLTVMNNEYLPWQKIPVHVFLFFAHILWPVWIPLSMLLLEKERSHKKILGAILVLAALLSISEVYCQIVYPVSVELEGHHIGYTVQFPKYYNFITEIMYVVVTLVPCFISGIKRMWLFGYALTITLVLSAIFYEVYLVSVWCFFAAVTSVVIYFIMSKLEYKKYASG